MACVWTIQCSVALLVLLLHSRVKDPRTETKSFGAAAPKAQLQRMVAPHYTPQTNKYYLHQQHRNHYKTSRVTFYIIYSARPLELWFS